MQDKKLQPHQAEAINRVAAQTQPQVYAERPIPERRKRPDVKINKPFEALAGFKVK